MPLIAFIPDSDGPQSKDFFEYINSGYTHTALWRVGPDDRQQSLPDPFIIQNKA